MKAWLSALLFERRDSASLRRTRGGLFVLAYLAGAFFLAWMFSFGGVSLTANDWMKEYMYLDILREAQLTNTIPWFWSEPFYHPTQKLLANPEIILTPHILLLRWMSNVSFVMVHLLLFYTAGFIGCVKIASRCGMGFVSFFLLATLFNLNGFIVAHLGIGHLQWAGYYLLPFFLLLFTDLCRETDGHVFRLRGRSVAISLMLFLLLLNGSFHVAIWCMLFMLLAGFWDHRLLPNVCYTLTLAVLLGLFRLLPAALFFPESPSFVSGFPGLPVFLEALTTIRGRNYQALGGMFGQLRWWEYTIHIGYVALFLLVCGLAKALKDKQTVLPFPLLGASMVLLALSMGDVYALIAESGLPFSTVQRVSTRFISIPLLVFFIVSCKGLDMLMREIRVAWRKTVLLGIPFILFEVLTHASEWRLGHLERLHSPVEKPSLTVVGDPYPEYRRNVYTSWAVSKSTLMVLCITLVLWRKKRIALGKTPVESLPGRDASLWTRPNEAV